MNWLNKFRGQQQKLLSFALAIVPIIVCTACKQTYESSKKPNPPAEAYAAEMKKKSATLAPMVISKHVASEGVLFPASKILSPASELLKRRLTFLETHKFNAHEVLDKTKTESLEVTRYYFADINSDECSEFREDSKRYPTSLTALQKLGLPDHLCVAKITNTKPISRYFYYAIYTTTRHSLGEDWSYKLALADYQSREVMAEVNEFGYCDTQWCWHGFRTHGNPPGQ